MWLQVTNEVVGVAFSGMRDAEGMGFIIPTPVVNLFLSEFQASGMFGPAFPHQASSLMVSRPRGP